jgi:hypothetical protein
MFDYYRSVSLLSNSQEFNEALEKILLRGQNMFSQKAYVYQYQKFGLEEDDIIDSFYKFQGLVKFYDEF